MRIFKFGGASVKDCDSIKNVANVLQKVGYSDTCMIVSAMGKTTNALERVVNAFFSKGDYKIIIQEIKKNHLDLCEKLFQNEKDEVYNEVNKFFSDLTSFFEKNKSHEHSYVYDQVVSCGELISTKIISSYLNSIDIKNSWIDARDYIKTDSLYREGKVNWKLTEENISKLNPSGFYITQGFIGSDINNYTTTLGREGSDYSAAIFAYCMNAKSVTIWKDVPGVLNADPRYFDKTQLLHHISYEEAIELTYYGASVIHPKTLQPLQKKEIPLFVKSFYDPENSGTAVEKGQPLEPKIPCFILKKDQHLIKLSSKDFSFITEDSISAIFYDLYNEKIKVNLIQNSARSLSLCVEDKYNNLNHFFSKMKEKYEVSQEEKVSLFTIRYFNKDSELILPVEKELLRQTAKETLQIVIKD